MQLKFQKSCWVIASIAVIIGVILWIPPFFLIHDQTLLSKLSSGLEQSLAGNGLKINIRQVHWERWNRLVASEIILCDTDGRTVPFAFEKLVIKINLLSLLQNRHQPETALREVELVNPRFQLTHYRDGTWNWQRYFTGSGRKMHFQTRIRVADATFLIRDARYGTYRFERVNGMIDLRNFPIARWDLQGKLDKADGFSWAMQGEMDSEQIIGRGTIDFNHAPLEQLRPFWPAGLSYRVRSGLSSGTVQLAWTKKGVWVEEGEASVKNAILNVSGFVAPFTVKKLKAGFSPKQITIRQSELLYHQAVINLTGIVESKTAMLLGNVKARHLDVADLAGVLPLIKEHQISGLVDGQLHVEGVIAKPVFDGKIIVKEGQFRVGGRDIRHIAGRFKLANNNLSIGRFVGNYNGASLGVSGQVRHILQPQYQLQIYGSGLNLSEFQSELAKLGITTDATTDFTGQITGDWRRPILSGNIALKRLTYQNYHLDSFALKFAWNIKNGTFQILEGTSDVDGGHLEIRGSVLANDEMAAWDFTGRFREINLANAVYQYNQDFSGTVSTDAVIRGNWKKGEKFNVGSIFGVLKGEHLTFKGLSVDAAQAVYTWQDGRFRLDSLQGNVDQGRIFGSLIWDRTKLLANMSVENVRLRSLLSNSEQYPIDGIFKGNITLQGPINNLSGKMIGKCDRISWLSRNVGDANGEFIYTNNRFEITMLDVTGQAGDFAVRGSFGLEQNSALNLSLAGNGINLKELAGWFPVGHALAINGEGRVAMTVDGSLSAPKYQGHVELSRPRLKNFTMNYGYVEFEGNLQAVRLTEIRLEDDRSFIRMSGVVDQEKLDLEYSGYLKEIGKLGLYYKGNIARGAINLNGRIAGNPEKPEVTAEIRGERIGLGNFSGQDLTAQLILKYPVVQIESLRLVGRDGRLETAGNINLTKPMQLDLMVRVTDMAAETLLTTLKVDHLAAGGKLSGAAEIKGTLTDPVIKAEGNFENGFINKLAVNGQFKIEYSHNNLQIQKVELRHSNGILVANGVWEDGKTLKIKALLSNFPLQTINLLTQFKSEFTGATNAELRLEWSQSGVAGEYQCQISDLALRQNRLGDIVAKGSYSEAGVTVSDCKLTTSGGALSVNGYLPWPLELVKSLNLPVHQALSRDIELKLMAREMPVEVLNFMPDRFMLSRGRMNGNLQLNGTFQNPVISGVLDCNNTQLNLPTVPLVADNVQLALNIKANEVDLQEATGNIKKGKFLITGQARLEKFLPVAYSLAASGSGIYYKNTFFDGFGNLKIDMTGSLDKTLLAGKISVYNCRIGISGNHNRHGKPWAPEFDLIIKAGKNVRYRQIGIADVGVDGEIRVKGTGARPKLSGKVVSEKGVLTLYGQNFIVRRGSALFKLEHGYLPYLEVESSYKTLKAEILLTVKGQVGVDLMVNLTSQPYLSQDEIYALLNWAGFNEEEPLTVDGMIGGNLSFVTDSLFGDVFNGVRNTLHLDYFYLESNYSENEFRINMGDYVTDDLFISYSRSLISDTPKESWGFDYHLTPELVIGGTYSIEDQMLWKLTYGFSLK